MKYIIAPRSAVVSHGITPSSPEVIEGNIIVNENELKFRYPDRTLGEIAAMVDGTIVSSVSALDFLKGRKSLTQIKQTENE